MEYVIKYDTDRIIYVSCNPKTLVADLKVIIGAEDEEEKVILKDMFPYTTHIETIAKLSLI